jgi:hypothetical protein
VSIDSYSPEAIAQANAPLPPTRLATVCRSILLAPGRWGEFALVKWLGLWLDSHSVMPRARLRQRDFRFIIS